MTTKAHPFDAYSDAQKALEAIAAKRRPTQGEWITFENAFLAYREDMGLSGAPARVISERAVWPKRVTSEERI